MGLESATYISQLVATNPVGATDPRSQGDDHLRLIKAVLQNTLPALSGAVTATHTELNQLHGGVLTSIGNGTAVNPSYSFASDTDSGLFRGGANDIRISAGGSLIAGFQLDGSSRPLFYIQDGSSAQPSLCFAVDTDTGIYRGGVNDIRLVAGGVVGLLVQQTNVGPNLQIQAIDGVVGAPEYSFANDPDTGFYRSASGSVAFSANGVLTHISSTNGLNIIDGSAALPAITFISDADTGLYRSGANTLAIACGGAGAAYFTSSNAQFLDGSSVAPGICFAAETTCGLARSAASTVTLSAGGGAAITIDNVSNSGLGQVRIHKQMYLDVNSSNSATAGAASALPATPQGYIAVTINGTQRRIPYYAN